MSSAFQIRMGGYKGVLVVADKFKNGVKIHTRKSMRKFDLDPKQKKIDLEIIRSSGYSPGYLNKQIISILWANGVDEDYLLQMQKDYISEINELYTIDKVNFSKKIPLILLHSLNSNAQDKIFKMHSKGINYYKDPLLGPLIKAVCYQKIELIK